MSTVTARLMNLSWKIAGVISFLVAGAYYAMFFSDGSAKVQALATLKSQVKEADSALKATKKAVEEADKFERNVKELSEEFNRIVTIMPEKLSMAEMTAMASDTALKSSVRLLKTEPKSEVTKSDFYETIEFGFQIEGNFSQITTFLSQLSRVPRLMTMEKVELENSSDVAAETPKLSFKATIIGYRYLPEKEEKKADPREPKPPGAPPPAASVRDSVRRVAPRDPTRYHPGSSVAVAR